MFSAQNSRNVPVLALNAKIVGRGIFGILISLSLVIIPTASNGTSVSQLSTTTTTSEVNSSTFALPASEWNCHWTSFKLGTYGPGTEFVGTISSSSSEIGVWLVRAAAYASFLQQVKGWVASCTDFRPIRLVLSYDGHTQYTIDWAVPDTDTYYFILMNEGNFDTAISVKLWARTTVAPTEPLPSTLVILWAAVGIIVCLAVAFIFVTKRKEGSKISTAPRTTSISGNVFCVNCGKELPAGWRFCRHCGAKQP